MLKVEPRGVYENGKVVDVDGIVYVLDGKVVCFNEPGIYDASVTKDARDLAAIGEDLYVSPVFPRRYGANTICVVFPDRDDSLPDVRSFLGLYKLSDLSVEMRDRVRKVCDDYDI